MAHGILLYNNSYDEVYVVTRFLDGLKEEIRSVIALHRPETVDTASALALLEEEEIAKLSARDSNKNQFKSVQTKFSPVEKLETLKSFGRKNGHGGRM